VFGSAVAGEPATNRDSVAPASASREQLNGPDLHRQALSSTTAVDPNQEEQIASFAFKAAAKDPNFSLASNGAGTKELFFKMIVSVLLVVALGAVAIYGSRRLMGKITNLPGKKIRIVETTHLGPRKAIHLLRVGDRCLLLGSTNESITKLADLTTDLVMEKKAFAADSASPGTTGSTAFDAGIEADEALADLSTAYTDNN